MVPNYEFTMSCSVRPNTQGPLWELRPIQQYSGHFTPNRCIEMNLLWVVYEFTMSLLWDSNTRGLLSTRSYFKSMLNSIESIKMPFICNTCNGILPFYDFHVFCQCSWTSLLFDVNFSFLNFCFKACTLFYISFYALL